MPYKPMTLKAEKLYDDRYAVLPIKQICPERYSVQLIDAKSEAEALSKAKPVYKWEDER